MLNKVREQPVTTWVKHPVTGERTEIHLTERAFADAVRVMMYHNAGEVPVLVEQALAGDFNPFCRSRPSSEPQHLFKWQNGTTLLYYLQRIR